MPEFKDGLTTDMRYAVYALDREFGPEGGVDDDHLHDPVNFYGLFVKPAYEARTAYHVMKTTWQMAVFPVSPRRRSIGGDRCYGSLPELPEPVDVVVSFLPGTRAVRLAAEMRACGITTLWRMYGPWVNTLTDGERAVYEAAGIRLIDGCILKHWQVPVDGLGANYLRHACVIHGLKANKVPSQPPRTASLDTRHRLSKPAAD
jgi:predicted CoA-binding protein